MKFIFKRFHVYDLIVRGNIKEAKIYFNSAFKEVINEKYFTHIVNYFSMIFNNTIGLCLIRLNYIELKKHFYKRMELRLSELLFKKDQGVCIEYVKGYTLGPCLPNENCNNYPLLDIELKLMKKIILCLLPYTGIETIKRFYEDMDFFNNEFFKINYMYIFQYISEMIQSKNNINFENYHTNNFDNSRYSIYQEDSNDSNNNKYHDLCNRRKEIDFLDYHSLEKISIRDLQQKDYLVLEREYLEEASNLSISKLLGFRYNIVEENLLVKKYVIGTNNKYSNQLKMIKYQNQRQFNKLDIKHADNNYDNITFRRNHSFLKNFILKSLKKETLDKIIIRRFKKEVKKQIKGLKPKNNSSNRKCLNSRSNKNKNNKISINIDTNTNTDSFLNIDDACLAFLVDFSNSKFSPPFNYQNTYFKSYNTSYLIWLFSFPVICSKYEYFSDEFAYVLNDEIISSYNLSVTDPYMCNKLLYYIKNLCYIYIDEKKQIDYLIDQSKINHADSIYIDDSKHDDLNNINVSSSSNIYKEELENNSNDSGFNYIKNNNSEGKECFSIFNGENNLDICNESISNTDYNAFFESSIYKYDSLDFSSELRRKNDLKYYKSQLEDNSC